MNWRPRGPGSTGSIVAGCRRACARCRIRPVAKVRRTQDTCRAPRARAAMTDNVAPAWHEFADADAMADALAAAIADGLRAAVADKGVAVFGASGGSTPFPAYRRLAAMPLPWTSLKVVIVDERWVPPGDPDHNETRIRASLLATAGDKTRVLGLWSEAPTVQAAATLADARVSQLARPLDVTLLGMGLDGH